MAVATCEVYGCVHEFDLALAERFEQIMGLIESELHVRREALGGLPLDTSLPPVAEEKFMGLRQWLFEQAPEFDWIGAEEHTFYEKARQASLPPPDYSW